MAEMQTYNRDDIQRYLQQQMSREEMHAFEKAMMDDPFLADAFEGFATSDATLAASHLAEIEQQISGGKERAKVVPMVPASKRWLRVAAMIIVLAGAGIITYRVLDKPQSAQEIAATQQSSPSLNIDTVSPADKPLATPQALPGSDVPVNQQNAGSPIITKGKTGTAAGTETAGKESSQNGATAMRDYKANVSEPPVALSAPLKTETANAGIQTNRQAASVQEFKGKVVDESGEPIPGAAISVRRTTMGVSADDKGNFTLKVPDSVVEVSVSANNYSNVETKLKSDKTNEIALNRSENSLQEVLITPLGKPRSKMAKGASGAVPEGGWQNFNRYVDSSLAKAKDADNSSLSGNVELEFNIDKKGYPFDIKSLKRSNKELENKAVELLKKGPKWRPGSKKAKAKVVIQF